MYESFFKLIFDYLIALILIVLLGPLLLFLILILLGTNKGKPFFLQSRPGKNGKLFKIIKFKTMRDLMSSENIDIHSTNRVTKIGKFIRKYSLDEILQLVNVLKGEMSLVGPRPLLTEYLPLYNRIQQKRHNVRPGITGLAQVNGRNQLSWNDKFALDVYYVEHMSFLLDLKILAATLIKVFKKEGVNHSKNTIMPVWQGNNPRDQKRIYEK